MAEGPLALGFEAPMFVPGRGVSVNWTEAATATGIGIFSIGRCLRARQGTLGSCPYILAKLAFALERDSDFRLARAAFRRQCLTV